ncbi:UTRA domain-containing protein [Rhodobacterales bacterium FZCC0083]|nr:UTRA domain-containing protein [Rhodobacterales bacterium FZCC0083]
MESLFPITKLSGSAAALSETSSVTEALSMEGIYDYTRVSTRVTAVRAPATYALLLQVSESDPLLRTSRVNASEAGEPVEYGRIWFAGDRVTLTLRHLFFARRPRPDLHAILAKVAQYCPVHARFRQVQARRNTAW